MELYELMIFSRTYDKQIEKSTYKSNINCLYQLLFLCYRNQWIILKQIAIQIEIYIIIYEND